MGFELSGFGQTFMIPVGLIVVAVVGVAIDETLAGGEAAKSDIGLGNEKAEFGIGPAKMSMDGSEVTLSKRERARTWASSELRDPKLPDRYSVKNVFDGKLDTAWVEGVPGDGEGEFVVVEFENPVAIDGFVLYPGYIKTRKTFVENSVPRVIEIYFDNEFHRQYTITYDLEIFIPEYELNPNVTEPSFRPMGCYHTGDEVNLSPRIVILDNPVRTSTIKLLVKSALSGSKYHDLCISECFLLFSEGWSNELPIDGGIILILRSLRDRNLGDLSIGADAFVEDLREKYVVLDYSKARYLVQYGKPQNQVPRTPTSPVFFPRLEESQVTQGTSIFDKFLNHTIEALVDSPVVVTSYESSIYLIGTKLGPRGDGEWFEFYPTIILSECMEIAALRELIYIDADPGCHYVIPEIKPPGSSGVEP